MEGVSTTTMLLYGLLVVGVFYLILIRPQQKYQKNRRELINNLRVRDRIVTAGGIYGRVTEIREDSILLLIAENVEVEVIKTGIMSVDNGEDHDDVIDLEKSE